MPAAAYAQDQCRALRGLTNLDGRRFADLAVGFARNPDRMTVRVGRSEALPTPTDCSLSVDTNELRLDCTWQSGDYAAANTMFGTLLASLQHCLDDRLAAPVGPRTYGGTATALRESVTTLPTAGGETRIELRLVEQPETTIPAYHYVTLGIGFEPGEPEED